MSENSALSPYPAAGGGAAQGWRCRRRRQGAARPRAAGRQDQTGPLAGPRRECRGWLDEGRRVRARRWHWRIATAGTGCVRAWGRRRVVRPMPGGRMELLRHACEGHRGADACERAWGCGGTRREGGGAYNQHHTCHVLSLTSWRPKCQKQPYQRRRTLRPRGLALSCCEPSLLATGDGVAPSLLTGSQGMPRGPRGLGGFSAGPSTCNGQPPCRPARGFRVMMT